MIILEIYDRFDIVFVVECERNILLEKKFKAHSTIKKVRFSYIFDGENRTELIGLNAIITIEKVIDIAKKLKREVDNTIDKEMKHNERVMELENEKMKEQTKQMEIELMKMKEETRQKEIELKTLELKILSQKQEPEKIEIETESEVEFEIVESDNEEKEEPEPTKEDENKNKYKKILNNINSGNIYKNIEIVKFLKELKCSVRGNKIKRLKEKLEEIVNNRKYCLNCGKYKKCNKFRNLLAYRSDQKCLDCEKIKYPNITIDINTSQIHLQVD